MGFKSITMMQATPEIEMLTIVVVVARAIAIVIVESLRARAIVRK